MKTIGTIALLTVALFISGAALQAQEDVGRKNDTGMMIADKVIMYIPNRIVELFDIFSLELGSGATAKLGVRLTHAFGIGAGIGPSGKVVKGFNRTYGFALDDGWQAYFLAIGKGDLTREYTVGNLPDFWYIYSGMQTPGESIFANKVKDYWALEVDAAALAVAGGEIRASSAEHRGFLHRYFLLRSARQRLQAAGGLRKFFADAPPPGSVFSVLRREFP